MEAIIRESDLEKWRHQVRQDALNAAADLLVSGMKEATVRAIVTIVGHSEGFMAIAKHRANLMKEEGRNGKKRKR